MDDIFGQRDHAVRFDWGLPGALATDADVCVVVDVLSFSTSVTIAVERGMQVFPFAWKDERAASYAARLGAVLAVGRLEATHEGSRGRVARWGEFHRGMNTMQPGPDDVAAEGGFNPESSNSSWDHETLYYSFYRTWQRDIERA